MMQQTVLLTAIRGPDGMPKYTSLKMLLRWYRRCVLLSALDGQVLSNPYSDKGGSFTGPSMVADKDWEDSMNLIVTGYLKDIDGVPAHFQTHFMHGAEILGYKHPNIRIRSFWNSVYIRIVHALHCWTETEEQLDDRLGDSKSGWLARCDPATLR